MPIYEYQCQQCSNQFEQLRGVTDESQPQCPRCEGASVRRLISSSSFRLAGTGWYATDYRNEARTDDAA